MGYAYRPKRRDGTPGRIWWVKYYVNSRPVRESTGADKEAEARRFLKLREGAAARGSPIPPRIDRIPYDELSRVRRLASLPSGTVVREVEKVDYDMRSYV